MAKATGAQVKQLERALGEQFFLLVQAAEFRLNLARKFGTTNPEVVKFHNKYKALVNKWISKEVKYEKAMLKSGKHGIIAQGDLKYNDFFYSAEFPKILQLAKDMIARLKQNDGLGFPPLIIWAVIWIIGLFTAEEIVDDLTTSTEEKEQLMLTTAQTVKDLGLTPEQAAGLISQTQAEAGGDAFGGIVDLAKWGLGIFVVVKVVLPMLNKSKASA